MDLLVNRFGRVFGGDLCIGFREGDVGFGSFSCFVLKVFLLDLCVLLCLESFC